MALRPSDNSQEDEGKTDRDIGNMEVAQVSIASVSRSIARGADAGEL